MTRSAIGATTKAAGIAPSLMNALGGFAMTNDREFAAIQAREQQLRKALGICLKEIESWCDEVGYERFNHPEVNSALALPADTSALDRIKAEYEAREQQLRNELFAVLVQDMPAFKARLKVEAIPADTSALEAVKAEVAAKAGEVMRERCATSCSGKLIEQITYAEHAAIKKCAKSIRALPGVTMEDIKNG